MEGDDYVVFNEQEAEAIANQGLRTTELTAFFAYNAANPGTQTKYIDFPKEFTWIPNQKTWRVRRTGKGGTIGRIHTIHPLSGDEFYLRILLHHDHCKGAASFIDLRTIDGELCDTYKEVCRWLGLLRDDNEWHDALNEAALTKSCPKIRDLFVTILLFCEPSNPLQLFQQHVSEWWDDFKRKYPEADEELLKAMVLQDIETVLQRNDKTLQHFQLPNVTEQQEANISEMTHEVVDRCRNARLLAT